MKKLILVYITQPKLLLNMSAATGWYHTICLSDNGEVFAFGKNSDGQLGLGHNKDVSIPTQIPTLCGIKLISCGYFFTACVDYEGFMWSFGQNNVGQLGTGNSENCNTPQKITDIPPVQSIACGGYHTLIITDDKTLWSVGKNDCRQLGLRNKENQSTFQQTVYTNIEKIAAGYYHSLFQNENGEIFSFGYNSNGELGQGHFNINFSDPEGYKPLQIMDQPPNIVQFCCGFHHTLLLDDEGNVFGFGINTYGCIGIDNNINQNKSIKIPNIPLIKTIACAGYSSYLIDVEGNVWSFGHNSTGQLGHTTSLKFLIPKKISTFRNIVQLSTGSYGYHVLAKNSENEIFVLGDNKHGQLGTETGKSIHIPVQLHPKYFTIWGNSSKSRAKSARK